MSKSKKDSSKSKTSSESIEANADPFALYSTYCSFCKEIGIPPHDSVKEALTNEENPNNGKQILIGAKNGEDNSNMVGPLGPGGCRALATSILGGAHSTNNPIIYTILKEIRIWKNNINDEGAYALAEILRLGGAEIQLSFLEIANSNIGPSGAQALGKSLSVGMNKSLITLSLDFNETLGSDGMRTLSRGLRTNSSLQKLSLRYCCIDEKGGTFIGEMLSFSRLALTCLDLKGNEIGSKGLSSMMSHSDGGGLKENNKLEELNIADNCIGSSEEDLTVLKAFADLLASHQSLHSIDLNHNSISTKGGMVLLDKLGPKNKRIKKFKVDKSISSDVYNLLCRKQADTKGGKKKKKKKKKKK